MSSPLAESTSKRRIHKVVRDIALTGAAGVSIIVSNVAVVSLCGKLMGAESLGEYLLVRRVITWLQAAVQVCSGLALPYCVARAWASGRKTDASVYLIAALAFSGFMCAVIGWVLLTGRSAFAQWLFGNANLANLIAPTVLSILSYAVAVSVYSYYRGLFQMGMANVMQVFNFAVFPIVAIGIFRRTTSVDLVTDMIAGLIMVSSLACAAPIFWKLHRLEPTDIAHKTAEMIRYGAPRIPGDFALQGLMVLGPLIASHFVTMKSVTYLLLGGNVLTAFAAAASPLGIVLLSKLTMMLAEGRVDDVRECVRVLVAAVLDLSLFASLQLWIFADVVLRAWVGSSFIAGAPVLRILLIGVPAYAYYVAFRSALDAASPVAYNTRNILISVVAFIVLTCEAVQFGTRSMLAELIAGAWSGALLLLAGLTTMSGKLVLGIRLPWRDLRRGVLLSTVMAGASLLVRAAQNFNTGLSGFVAIELVLFPLFLIALRKSGTYWPSALYRMGTSVPTPAAERVH